MLKHSGTNRDITLCNIILQYIYFLKSVPLFSAFAIQQYLNLSKSVILIYILN